LSERLLIAVGTTSEQKLRYIHQVLDQLRINGKLFPVQVSSGVSEQPLTSAETKTGSLHRARNALDVTEQANCALGIEIGYEPDEAEQYSIFGWATLMDRSNVVISARSQAFRLPHFHQQLIKNGLPLSDYVTAYVKRSIRFEQRYLAEMIQERAPLIQQAAEAVLLQYINLDQFESSSFRTDL
jgi:non-canonical (house-cleaning) NTP pyrophosphatase